MGEVAPVQPGGRPLDVSKPADTPKADGKCC